MDELYGLSYEARGEKPIPTLIINIKRAQEEEAMEILRKVTQREPDERQVNYLKKKKSLPFALENGFGHGSCGVIEKDDNHVRFTFPLARRNMRETVVTINTLMFCLSARIEDYYSELVQTDLQLFTFDTTYGESHHYSHAIMGYPSRRFKDWLDDYHTSHPKIVTRDGLKREIVFFPDYFIEGMARSWHKLSGRKPSQMAMDGVGGWVRGEQLFTFVCPGNAASAAIYPGHEYQISSHNVWAPEMQLTLLTGLFCLFEFIQKHPDAKSAP